MMQDSHDMAQLLHLLAQLSARRFVLEEWSTSRACILPLLAGSKPTPVIAAAASLPLARLHDNTDPSAGAECARML